MQSSQERIERLKAMLTGRSSNRRTGAALASSGELGNLLLGVALHGADRLRENRLPTDLEMALVAALHAAIDGEEVKAWGAAYREVVQSADPGTLVVPEVITSRPSSSGYGVEDLAEVIPQLSQEAGRAANVSLLTAEDLAAGRIQEDAAFVEAMRETGFAVTGGARYPGTTAAAAAGSQDTGTAQNPAPAADSWRVRLEMENFYVERAVGDQGGGRDEIYFTAAASAGGKKGEPFVSEEFGKVVKGQTRTFSSNNKVFLDQQCSGGLVVASIQVWEADQSNAAWYANLQKALNTTIERIDALLNNPVAIIADPTPLPVTIAYEVTKVFVALMDALRNDDDLSDTRTFVLSRDDMAILTHQPNLEWNFNGDGHHILRVRYTGERPVYPEGSIEIISRAQPTGGTLGGAWSVPIPLGWKTRATPALASYRGDLYTVFSRSTDNRLVWSRYDGTAWSTPRIIGSAASDRPCALAVHQDQLHLMYTGGDSKVYHGWFDGQQWSPLQPFLDWKTGFGPALVEVHNHLWAAATGGNTVYAAKWKQNVTGPVTRQASPSGAAYGAPALGSSTFKAILDHRQSDDSICSRFPDNWTGREVRSWRTRHAPTVHHSGSYDWMAHIGTDGRVYLSWRDTHKAYDEYPKPKTEWEWTNRAEVIEQGTWTCTPLETPAHTTHNRRLYAIYHTQA
ncbi:hypothetical protein [Streptomyces syringium]|uniref:hypothetical protein n=1 Tax=Streptomyces syringium TaxID=76729 RepID=UPI003425C045